MGPSGCGKSTLLHLCGAMDRPTRGRLTFEGRDARRPRRRRADARCAATASGSSSSSSTCCRRSPWATTSPSPVCWRGCRWPRPRRGPRNWRHGSGLRTASPTTRSRSRAARPNGQRSRAPWSTGRPWSSPTSRPATSTRRTAPTVLALLRRAQPRPRHHDPAGHARQRGGAGRGPHRAPPRRTPRRGRMRGRLFRQFVVRRLVGEPVRTTTTVAGIAARHRDGDRHPAHQRQLGRAASRPRSTPSPAMPRSRSPPRPGWTRRCCRRWAGCASSARSRR